MDGAGLILWVIVIVCQCKSCHFVMVRVTSVLSDTGDKFVHAVDAEALYILMGADPTCNILYVCMYLWLY